MDFLALQDGKTRVELGPDGQPVSLTFIEAGGECVVENPRQIGYTGILDRAITNAYPEAKTADLYSGVCDGDYCTFGLLRGADDAVLGAFLLPLESILQGGKLCSPVNLGPVTVK